MAETLNNKEFLCHLADNLNNSGAVITDGTLSPEKGYVKLTSELANDISARLRAIAEEMENG